MKLERNITITENEGTIRNRVDTYLREIGYKQLGTQLDLIYERGSTIGSWLSFSPKAWKAKTTVQFKVISDEKTDVYVNIDINTTGQLVTEKERRFWSIELEGLEAALQTGMMDVKAVTGSERSSLIENSIVAAVIIVLTVGLAVVSVVLFETQTSLFLGGLIGLALGAGIAKKWLKF